MADGAGTMISRGYDVPETDDSPWLTDRQQRVWRLYLSMTRMLSDRIEREMQQSGAMPMAYYLVLAMLSEAPGRRLRMNRLAEILDFSQSRLSHAISRLEELGWVVREQATNDKRGQIANLTEAGFQRLVQVAPDHARTVRNVLFEPLSERQVEVLESICRTILGAQPDYVSPITQMDSPA